MIQAGRRQALLESRKISGEMPLDSAAEVFFPAQLLAAYGKCRLRQFRVHDRACNGLLRIERRQPACQIFEFANVARPAMPFKAIESGLVHLLRRQTLTLGLREKMSNEIRNILGAFAQRWQP